MATDRLFDRRIIPVRQRPLSTDHNLMFGLLQEQLRTLFLDTYGQRYDTNPLSPPLVLAPAFEGGFSPFSFIVEAGTGMSVEIGAGHGLSAANVTAETDLGGNLGTNVSAYAPTPLVLSTTETLAVPAAPAVGSSRIDIIEVRPNYALVDVLPQSIWDILLRRFTTQNVPKTLTWDLAGLSGNVLSPAASTAAISYKAGVAVVGAISAATEPTATAGYLKVARVNVLGGTVGITSDLIADLRPFLLPQGQARVTIYCTFGSATGGLGAETVDGIQSPPGVWARMIDAGSPVAGRSHTYNIYVFGLRTTGFYRALLTGHSTISGGKPILVEPTTGSETRVNTALRAALNSGACIGGAVNVAEGTPVTVFTVNAGTTTLVTADLPAATFPVILNIDFAQGL